MTNTYIHILFRSHVLLLPFKKCRIMQCPGKTRPFPDRVTFLLLLFFIIARDPPSRLMKTKVRKSMHRDRFPQKIREWCNSSEAKHIHPNQATLRTFLMSIVFPRDEEIRYYNSCAMFTLTFFFLAHSHLVSSLLCAIAHLIFFPPWLWPWRS